MLTVKEAIVGADPSRAITGNLGWQGVNATRPGTPFDDVMDVMGMSHQSAAVLEAFHAASPFKAVAMTECCSCETMRAADADQPQNASVVYYSNEASACLAAQTQVSNSAAYCAGCVALTARARLCARRPQKPLTPPPPLHTHSLQTYLTLPSNVIVRLFGTFTHAPPPPPLIASETCATKQLTPNSLNLNQDVA